MNPKYLLLALLLLLSGASHAATYITNSTGNRVCCGTNCTTAVARTLLGYQLGDCTESNSGTTRFYSTNANSTSKCLGAYLGLHGQSTAPCGTCTTLELKDGTCVADQAGAAAVGSTPSAPGDIPGTDDNGEETPPVCSPGAGLGKLICKNGWVFQCESSTSVSGGENGSSETCAYGPCVRTSAQCNPYTPSGGCRENEKAIGAGCLCAPGAIRVNGVCNTRTLPMTILTTATQEAQAEPAALETRAAIPAGEIPAATPGEIRATPAATPGEATQAAETPAAEATRGEGIPAATIAGTRITITMIPRNALMASAMVTAFARQAKFATASQGIPTAMASAKAMNPVGPTTETMGEQPNARRAKSATVMASARREKSATASRETPTETASAKRGNPAVQVMARAVTQALITAPTTAATTAPAQETGPITAQATAKPK